jgi:uncharacterized protein (DUF4415 family)
MKAHYDFSKGKRGPVLPQELGKQRITIRLDSEVLDWFRARVQGGGNYQTLINEALKSHIRAGDMREMIREVLREELRARDKQAA